MNKLRFGKTKETVGQIGFGTYRLGGGWLKRYSEHDSEDVSAIMAAIGAGSTFIDTAEAYGAGHSEELVGRAVASLVKTGDIKREDVFIATKVSEDHLSYDGVMHSCAGSLRRLGMSCVDLYQVHWPNPHIPIRETMSAFERLVAEGKARYIGVSNFSVEQFVEARNSLSKYELQSDQVSYSFFDRSPEPDMLEFGRKDQVSIIAYSPLGAGKHWNRAPPAVSDIAVKYGRSMSQILLNWLAHKGNVIPIPKASSAKHILENAASTDFIMDDTDYALIDSLRV